MSEELPLGLPLDPDKIDIRVPALLVRQPVGDMYLASMDARQIKKIAWFDVRRIAREAREVETYLGIQRPLNEKRVQEIAGYVNFQDASFPGAIILAIESDYADFDADQGVVTIRNYRLGDDKPSRAISDIARVLDGQHRIAGLEGLNEETTFQVIVTLFIGADIADQAYIFATVNLEQRKVNRSLAFDLFALARSRSPERTCHNIAVTFDQDADSPFHKRIKRLGTATPGRDFETLTQATFVDGLLRHISRTPKADRDKLLRRHTLPKPTPEERNKLIFRHFFVSERDLDIASVFHEYFCAVRDRWPNAWKERGAGFMLNRTNGYRALCRFLRPAFRYYSDGTELVRREQFRKIFDLIELEDGDFNVAKYPPGTSGESALLNDFLEQSNLGEVLSDS